MPHIVEVPPSVVAECVVKRVKKRSSSATGNPSLRILISVLPRLIEAPLADVKSMGVVLQSCWEVYEILSRDPFWLKYLGYKLKSPPVNVSPLRLYIRMHAETKAEAWDKSKLVKVGNWTSGGDVARHVNETVQTRKLTNLMIFASNADSNAFWIGRVVELLQIKAFPNEEEVKELRFALGKVLDQTETPSFVAMLEEQICKISNPNQTLVCVVLAKLLGKRNTDEGLVWAGDLLDFSKEGKGTGADVGPPGLQQPSFAYERLMTSVNIVQYTAALICGKEVSELKDAKWSLKGSMPAAFRRSVMRALAAMSTQHKMDIFKKTGLMKSLFKSIHLRSLLKNEIKKVTNAHRQAGEGVRLGGEDLMLLGHPADVDGLRQLYLFLAILHKDEYPVREDYWTGVEAHQWGEIILPALAQLSQDAMFEVPAEWILPNAEQCCTYQPQLANKKVPQPYRNDPSALLAREGNTTEAWDRLMELSRQGVLTPLQAMLYLRVMLLLGYPCKDTEDVAGSPRPRTKKTKADHKVSLDSLLREGVRKGVLTWVQLLKAIKMIEENFNGEEITRIAALVRANGETEQAAGTGTGLNAGGTVRVSLGMETFKDKSGNSHQREKWRMVSSHFGPEVVGAYVGMLRGLLDVVLATVPATSTDRTKADYSGDIRRAAVICCTPDLLNTIRTGLPPVVPAYSRSVLWRGEHVCLQQVADDDEVCEFVAPPCRLSLNLRLRLPAQPLILFSCLSPCSG
jgi:hypothetical protein